MDIWKMARSNDGIEELKKNLLGLDSTFQFKCRKCGKCCKNQDTILFSPMDVFRIAKKLEISPDAVIKRYTAVPGLPVSSPARPSLSRQAVHGM